MTMLVVVLVVVVVVVLLSDNGAKKCHLPISPFHPGAVFFAILGRKKHTQLQKIILPHKGGIDP